MGSTQFDSFQSRPESGSYKQAKQKLRVLNNLVVGGLLLAFCSFAQAAEVTYGTNYHIRSNSNGGSYLDSCGKSECTDRYYVVTDSFPDRVSAGTGIWVLVSAQDKLAGETVLIGDQVYIKNRYGNGSYLDTCNVATCPNDTPKNIRYGVSTHSVHNRVEDSSTGTWTIESATGGATGTAVTTSDQVYLKNNYQIGGGYLDTCVPASCAITTRFKVVTDLTKGGETDTWSFQTVRTQIYNSALYGPQAKDVTEQNTAITRSTVMMYEDDKGWKGGGDKWEVSIGRYTKGGKKNGGRDLPVPNDEVRSLVIPTGIYVNLYDDDSFSKQGSHGYLQLEGPGLFNINTEQKNRKMKKTGLAGKVSSFEIKPSVPKSSRSAVTLNCKQGERCEFNGTKMVYFGHRNSGYVGSTYTNGVDCNPENFLVVNSDVSTTDNSKACWVILQPHLPWRWIKCADEGGTCKLGKLSTKHVWYGARTSYYVASHTDTVLCSPGSFGGDPYPYLSKSCYVAIDMLPDNAYKCAAGGNEEDRCEFDNAEFVYYGNKGRFFKQKVEPDGADCSLSNFGTPFTFGNKDCYLIAKPLKPDWFKCADEGGTCHFIRNVTADVTAVVAYGAESKYIYKTFHSPPGEAKNTACSNDNFRKDRAYGTKKACYMKPFTNYPSEMTHCSDEDSPCNRSAAGVIYFGANGKFAARIAPATVNCSTDYFGDPAPGATKACYSK
jgi:hypothetical protein